MSTTFVTDPLDLERSADLPLADHQDHEDRPVDDRRGNQPDWSRARCSDGNGTLTHLFFSEDLIDIARAKAICSKCTLATACLSGALERAEPFGVWGGQLLANGEVVVHKRRRGRPPKHPRPDPVVEEVMIPPHLLVVRHTPLATSRVAGDATLTKTA